MSSQAEQPSLILTRRLADGTIEWIPLETPARVTAAPDAAYALIDRADYEAPETMVVQRQGEDLVVEVQGTDALVLEGFFSITNVAFYSTPDIAGGAGPFSGSPLTPDSSVPTRPVAAEQLASAADDGGADADEEGDAEEEELPDGSSAGGTSPMVWVGVGAGGLALAALAGGGGGGSSGGGSTGGGGSPGDTVAPEITSGDTADSIAENSGAGQVVYDANATDAGTVTWSLAGADAGDFNINPSDGEVTLTANPDFETKSSYSFTVVATDAAGNSSQQAVSLAIEDQDDSAPFITSGATATPIDENSGAGQVIYTATATDDGAVTYGLQAGGDAAAFSIDAGSGAVTLTGDPDFETTSSYSFTVVATDTDGNSSQQAVSLDINNLDEVAPSITSGDTATPIDENSGGGQVIYTVTSADSGDISTGSTTYSLANVDDVADFSINAGTGAVTLTDNPDFETKSSYSFTVVATDAAGNGSQQAVSLAIEDQDDSAPFITSGATATPIDENGGASQVVYTVTATDDGVLTYSLANVDDFADFSINASTGAVTLTGDPDFETKSSYSFTVVATDDADNSSQQAVSLGINNLDEVAPSITSGATATAIDENSGADQVVYTVVADDSGDISGGVTYGLSAVDDGPDFSINTNTGVVRLTGNPDFETKSSYDFTVVATDAAGNSSQQAVSLDINNLDDSAPFITSGATATPIDENSGASQVVYTVTATDDGVLTYSLANVDDVADFSIDGSTGAVTLTGDPDFETKPGYDFTVVATDDADNSSQQAVSLGINNLDEVAPSITSGDTATPIDENSGGGQVIYTVTSTDSGDISTGSTTYSLANVDDVADFSINGSTGAVTLTGDPDFETKSSYSFTVEATDAAGNSSQLAVSLDINNLDEVAPSITSGDTATAIDENSGGGQVIYTVTSTDSGDISTGSTTYSLANVDDVADFSINGSTGAVTLTGDPDFETKPSYDFTVVATDAASNSSQLAVSLDINDLDEIAPTVSSVALTGATGAQNDTLNAGDTVTVTVTMSENTLVGGTPQIALTIGISTVFASYTSGSGSTSLTFDYTVQPGDNDSNGISIPADGLQLSGGSLTDAAGNAADLSHDAVADNASYLVDTEAPTLSSSTPADDAIGVPLGEDIVLTFSENVQADSGDIDIRTGGDNRTIDVTDGTQVSISGNQVTVDPTDDLEAASDYRVQIDSSAITDAAGNEYAGISDNTTLNFDTVDDSIVVFDLVEGVSSDHSDRTFDGGTSYTIYVRVNSSNATLSTDGSGPGPSDSWGTWSGGNTLGTDDRIVLVGSGANVQGAAGTVQNFSNGTTSVQWNTTVTAAAVMQQNGSFARITGATNSVGLWSGNWASNPNIGSLLGDVYQTAMTGNILTSQGLA